MGLPESVGVLRARRLMRVAYETARATPPGDVPVGAVVLGPGDEIVARACNRREADGDPTAHAEVLALRAAAQRVGDGWRLEECTLVVTLEPCAMCAGAIVGARVREVIFGAFEPRTGACGSVWDILRDGRAMHHVQVRGGVLEDECRGLLDDFFRDLRGTSPKS